MERIQFLPVNSCIAPAIRRSNAPRARSRPPDEPRPVWRPSGLTGSAYVPPQKCCSMVSGKELLGRIRQRRSGNDKKLLMLFFIRALRPHGL